MNFQKTQKKFFTRFQLFGAIILQVDELRNRKRHLHRSVIKSISMHPSLFIVGPHSFFSSNLKTTFAKHRGNKRNITGRTLLTTTPLNSSSSRKKINFASVYNTSDISSNCISSALVRPGFRHSGCSKTENANYFPITRYNIVFFFFNYGLFYLSKFSLFQLMFSCRGHICS